MKIASKFMSFWAKRINGTHVAGYVDDFGAERVRGWAWRPGAPEVTVEIQVIANGVIVASGQACDYRSDVAEAGCGHGRYGFNLLHSAPDALASPLHIVVRSSDGTTLEGGDLNISFTHQDRQRIQNFVRAVFNTEDADNIQRRPARLSPIGSTNDVVRGKREAPVQFILASALPEHAEQVSDVRFNYREIMESFAVCLAGVGAVQLVQDAAREADELYVSNADRGLSSVLLYFGPLDQTPLPVYCPMIPVIAWEFPHLPAAGDVCNRRSVVDVLRRAGRAFALSSYAANAIKSAMGPDFSVAVIATPIWDRSPRRLNMGYRQPSISHGFSVEGAVFDSAGQQFHFDAVERERPRPVNFERGRIELLLDGVVFLSQYARDEPLNNWRDLVSAFLWTFANVADATLVLVFGANRNWRHDDLSGILWRLPPFKCRLVVLVDLLNNNTIDNLMETSHWFVTATEAEAICAPLLGAMCAGRPAIGPIHSAILDFADSSNTLLVHSEESLCCWPWDLEGPLTAARHKIIWSSLSARLTEGYQIATTDWDLYLSMGHHARAAAKNLSTDAVVASKVCAFLACGEAGAADSIQGNEKAQYP